MKARLAIFVALIALCLLPQAKASAFAPEPGALEQGFGFTISFANVDQIYSLPSTVFAGDVDIHNPDNSIFEVLRFIPLAAQPANANTAIIYTSDELPTPLSNKIDINGDFVSGITTYIACHCDTYHIPTVTRTIIVNTVPLPTSFATGGLGVLAVIAGGWLKSRRSAIA